MSKIIDKVAEGITAAVNDLGIEIIEVTYKKIMSDMNLTVFIDKIDGIALDDCEIVHKTIDLILDELDPTAGEPYVLNVSSPGADRPLKTIYDYNKNVGKDVNISLFEKISFGKKFVAMLESVDFESGIIVVKTDKDTFTLDIKNIALIKPEIKF